jgi:RimJ/RimL family protein N-acetyltransferase
MTVTLRRPTLAECEQVRQWRNAPDVLPTLRTKEPLTAEQQAAFFRDVICNPLSTHRFFALEAVRLGYVEFGGEFESVRKPTFIGLGGLTYLDRAPGEGEISLLLGPDFRGRGFGDAAVQALRAKATELGLEWIVGECYDTNPAQAFWVKVLARCDGHASFQDGRMFFRMPPL